MMGNFNKCLYLLCSSVFTIICADTSRTESPSDVIWKVNENVKPKPLANFAAMEHRPPELSLDANTKLSEQLFEGCITLDVHDEEILANDNSAMATKRRVITGNSKRWPDSRIPYEIVNIGLTNSNQGEMTEKINSALKNIMSVTCLIFKPKTADDKNWIQFYDGQGCHADLGKNSQPNTPTQISIGKGCDSNGVITHLLLHGLGFLHEENRVDRDNYVNVLWENIQPEYQEIFRRRSFSSIDILSGQYNYHSIMHTSNHAYHGNNGIKTIVAKHDPGMSLGGMTLNSLDVMDIKLFFKCSRFEWKQWGSWSECSRPCGVGYHRRKRVCGGKPGNCPGHPTEFRTCRIARCHPAPTDTTFEDDWGAWKPRSENGCNWRRGRSRKKKQATGPQEDHTTGTGRFAQVKYGDACQKGVLAKIRTDRLPPSPVGRCVSFVYFLNGEGVGSLEVQIKELTAVQGTSVWKRQGNQGKGWHQGAAFVPPLPYAYQIFLIATIGEPSISDISVDDVYIDNGKCPDGLAHCKNSFDKCKLWAAEGECYSNHKWMLLSCCQSCLVIPECVDHDQNCANKASSGECSVNKREMWSRCCKSCQGCLDKDNRCGGWAENGECESNAQWMAINCSKSCSVCKA